ncbi:MAG: DUF2892 domain-containing protein [bacterium]|jgi:hypothetical protein|nr:MAG: DUF2892 domain-containing protein [bacterium]
MSAGLNVGTADRVVRIVSGLALVAFALAAGGLTGTEKAIAWGAGMVLFATGVTAYSPAYALAGIRTRRSAERDRRTATRT